VSARRLLTTTVMMVLAAAYAWAQGSGHISGGPGFSAPSGHITQGPSSGRGSGHSWMPGSGWGSPHHSSDFDLNNGFGWNAMGFGGTQMTTGLCFIGFGVVGSSSFSESNPFTRCNPIWTCWPAPRHAAIPGQAAAEGHQTTAFSSRAESAPAESPTGGAAVSLGKLARELKLQRNRQTYPPAKLYTNENLPKR
jgi:hypothetical protein